MEPFEVCEPVYSSPSQRRSNDESGNTLWLLHGRPGEKAADIKAGRPTSTRVCLFSAGLSILCKYIPYLFLALQRGGREVENGHAASFWITAERSFFSSFRMAGPSSIKGLGRI